MFDPPRAGSVEAHRGAAPDSVRCAVLTVSDTRTAETDSSGRLVRDLLEMRGHVVVAQAIVPDDAGPIRLALGEWAGRDDVQAILSNGGTGIAGRDTTYDAIVDLLEKRLDGFGELFRMLSYAEIGAAAMLSRAVAGVYRGKLVAAMPGSSNAVQLAMTKLLLPEIGHLVYEIRK